MAELTTLEDIQLFQEYLKERDIVRGVMANGVYPNCVSALEKYKNLVTWLESHSDYTELHNTTTSQVAPYIVQLIIHMEAIIAIMIGIEKAKSGTFGIQIPLEEEK